MWITIYDSYLVDYWSWLKEWFLLSLLIRTYKLSGSQVQFLKVLVVHVFVNKKVFRFLDKFYLKTLSSLKFGFFLIFLKGYKTY